MFSVIRNIMFVLLLIFNISNASEKTKKLDKCKLESLIVSTEQTIFTKNYDENLIKAPIMVMATYSDGHSGEVTDLVTWNKTSKRIKLHYDYFEALEGDFTVSASLKGVVSNEIKIKVIDVDINNTGDNTVMAKALVSEDPHYNGFGMDDIVTQSNDNIKLITPPLQAKRGAIRGVPIYFSVLSKHLYLEYSLVTPPKGMRIKEDYNPFDASGGIPTIAGVIVEWHVPMDIEEKTYTITMRATDQEGKAVEVSFPIKVPKTMIIPTKVQNNELIVTDESSPLFGMKMKGHSDEDISNIQLRSVAYEDVWKKKVKDKSPEDVVERIVFIVDNMPEKLNVKMPEYMDTYKERIDIGTSNDVYTGRMYGRLNKEVWDRAAREGYTYENTNGLIYNRGIYDYSKVYLITIRKAQNIGE